MDTLNLKAVADKMAKIDICMMQTRDGRGTLHSRPMSNNGQVEFDGNSYFFTNENSGKVRQLKKNSKTTLIFQTDKMLFIEVCGRGKIVTDKTLMQKMWYDELSQWFPQGLETPGICMVQVIAERVHIWDKGDEGVMIAAKPTVTRNKKSGRDRSNKKS